MRSATLRYPGHSLPDLIHFRQAGFSSSHCNGKQTIVSCQLSAWCFCLASRFEDHIGEGRGDGGADLDLARQACIAATGRTSDVDHCDGA